MKSGIALVVGRGAFRRRTVTALVITGVVAIATLTVAAAALQRQRGGPIVESGTNLAPVNAVGRCHATS
jgi:hypothetical protein